MRNNDLVSAITFNKTHILLYRRNNWTKHISCYTVEPIEQNIYPVIPSKQLNNTYILLYRRNNWTKHISCYTVETIEQHIYPVIPSKQLNKTYILLYRRNNWTKHPKKQSTVWWAYTVVIPISFVFEFITGLQIRVKRRKQL